MEWRHFTRAQYVTTAWSGGTTTQLAIAPEEAVYCLLYTSQEGVAVVEEVGALLMELADHLIVMLQSLVNQLGEALGIDVYKRQCIMKP